MELRQTVIFSENSITIVICPVISLKIGWL